MHILGVECGLGPFQSSTIPPDVLPGLTFDDWIQDDQSRDLVLGPNDMSPSASGTSTSWKEGTCSHSPMMGVYGMRQEEAEDGDVPFSS